MKPQTNSRAKQKAKHKVKYKVKHTLKQNSALMFLLYSVMALLLPMQLQAASISEELLKKNMEDNATSSAITATAIKTNMETPSVKLTVSPKQCVAMQQGQRCYLQVNVDFQANVVDDYCLYLSTEQVALQCWEKAKQGQLSYAFDSKVDLEFRVKVLSTAQSANEKSLATAKVNVAWVHEKKGKPRMSWRLF